MTASYQLKVVTESASVHRLQAYPGASSCMHGHNWKIELEAVATKLDGIGMAVDFKTMKSAAKEVGECLGHRYLIDLEPLTSVNSTAENVAACIYHEIASLLNSDTIRVQAVTLW